MQVKISIYNNKTKALVSPSSKVGDVFYRQIESMLAKQDYEGEWIPRYCETVLHDADGDGTFICEVDGAEIDAEVIAQDICEKFEGRKRHSVSCDIED